MALHDQEITPNGDSCKTYKTVANARKAAIAAIGTMPADAVQYIIGVADSDTERFSPVFFLRPEHAMSFHYFVNKGFSVIVR